MTLPKGISWGNYGTVVHGKAIEAIARLDDIHIFICSDDFYRKSFTPETCLS